MIKFNSFSLINVFWTTYPPYLIYVVNKCPPNIHKTPLYFQLVCYFVIGWNGSRNVWFMSYSKCWNCCRTWIICFLLIFSWKMLQPNFAFWDTFMLLKCLNSKEIKLQSSIRVICIMFDLIFFQLKIKKKTEIPSSTTISTLRIWNELR